MWYKFCQSSSENISEDLEDLANKRTEYDLSQSHENEMPLITDIDTYNELAQYIAMYIKNKLNEFDIPKKKWEEMFYSDDTIQDLQNFIHKASDQALKEASIFNQEYYKVAKESMDKALEKSFNFEGLMPFNRKIQNINDYIRDFPKVFRYIFLIELRRSVEKFNLSYYPHYTKRMREWSPLRQDTIWSKIIEGK